MGDVVMGLVAVGRDKFEDYVAKELRSGSERMDKQQAQLDEHRELLIKNTDATGRIESNTADLVEAFENLKGAFRVLNWIGRLAKPLSAIIGLGLAVWAAWSAFKTGVHPK